MRSEGSWRPAHVEPWGTRDEPQIAFSHPTPSPPTHLRLRGGSRRWLRPAPGHRWAGWNSATTACVTERTWTWFSSTSTLPSMEGKRWVHSVPPPVHSGVQVVPVQATAASLLPQSTARWGCRCSERLVGVKAAQRLSVRQGCRLVARGPDEALQIGLKKNPKKLQMLKKIMNVLYKNPFPAFLERSQYLAALGPCSPPGSF